MPDPADTYPGYPQSSDSLADRIRQLQAVADLYGQKEEDLATQTAGASGGLSLGEGLASALVSILPAVLGKAAGGKYGGVYGAKGGAAAGGLFNQVIQQEKENKRKDLLTLAPVLSARKQKAEEQITRLTEGQEKLEQRKVEAEDRKTAQTRHDDMMYELGKSRIDAQQSRADDRKREQELSEPFKQSLIDSAASHNKERELVGLPPLNLSQMSSVADEKLAQQMLKGSRDEVDTARRLQTTINGELDKVTKTAGPIIAAGGRFRMAKDGSVAEPDQETVKQVLEFKRGKEIVENLATKLAKAMTKNGLYINTSSEEGKKLANEVYSLKSALLQEYGGTSIFRQNGITEKEIRFLDNILPSDPNKFDQMVRTGVIRSPAAEVQKLGTLVNNFNDKFSIFSKNSGIEFPDVNGNYKSQVAGLPEVLRYRALKTGNPALVSRADILENAFVNYQKFQKLPPEKQKGLVLNPLTGGYRRIASPDEAME